MKKIISKVFLKFLSLFEGGCKKFTTETKYTMYSRKRGVAGYKFSLLFKRACFFPSTLAITYSNWKLLKESISISASNSSKKSEVGKLKNGKIKDRGALKLKQHKLIINSLSFFNENYSQTWKTIFHYMYEKSNLLVRLDKNTGFSYQKVLQTTTI